MSSALPRPSHDGTPTTSSILSRSSPSRHTQRLGSAAPGRIDRLGPALRHLRLERPPQERGSRLGTTGEHSVPRVRRDRQRARRGPVARGESQAIALPLAGARTSGRPGAPRAHLAADPCHLWRGCPRRPLCAWCMSKFDRVQRNP